MPMYVWPNIEDCGNNSWNVAFEVVGMGVDDVKGSLKNIIDPNNDLCIHFFGIVWWYALNITFD